jgi:hypothetical protein
MAEIVETVVSLGPISIPQRKLVELVAESTTFRDRVGAVDSDTAMPFIHTPYAAIVPSLDSIKKPCAVVCSSAWGLKRVNNTFLRPDGCVLTLTFAAEDRYPDNIAWSQTDFENFCGGVIADLAALQGVDDRLAIDSIRRSLESSTSDEPLVKGGWYWISVFEVFPSRL